MLNRIENTKSASNSSSQANKKNMPFFQPKMNVGTQGDKFEVEADKAAEHVTESKDTGIQPFFASSGNSSFNKVNPSVQTAEQETVLLQSDEDEDELQLCPDCSDEELQTKREGNTTLMFSTESSSQFVSKKTEDAINSEKGGGEKLDSTVRRKMENNIGANFSDVNIHTGAYSAELNKGLGAQAFSTGNDIFFNEGKYQPDSKSGQKLLAHELTHVVQQQPDRVQRSCNDNSCPFEELEGSVIQKQDNPATEAPQNTDPPLDVNDTLPTECGDIEQSSVIEIEDFLRSFHDDVQDWESWRNQENWDNPAVSSTIPTISPLLASFNSIYNTDFYCTESMIYVIPFTHTEIQRLIMDGTGSVAGINNYELDLVNEWMRYDKNRVNELQDHFNLNPESDVEHHYTMNVIAAVGDSDDIAAVGAGLGGALETPVGKLKLGCFLKLGIGGGYVVFRYSNNIGMTFEQGYVQINAGLSGECSISASIGPAVSSSFGNEELCSGSADPDPTPDWYGPKDFEGGTIEQSIGVSSGLGLTAGVDAAYLYLLIPGKNDLFFNTSGACLGLELGGHLNLPSINIIQGGGQFSVGGFEGEPGEIQPHEGECDTAEMAQYTEQLVSRIVYFNTAGSDLHSGALAENNEAALAEIVGAISNNLDNPFLTSISISVVGHASPIWRGAGTEERAAEENMSLAMERAQNTSFELYDGLNTYSDLLPPVSIYPSGVCEEGSPASEVDFDEESRGSEEGLAETGDPQNDWQLYRRADIMVYVSRIVDENITLVMDEVNPENNVCQ
ncbi:eCIS core domain-containing protein [Maribellus maritimus]|uniref:eCIS core domain-containing protein n=1 Tax=Maribellus maritimus TaxID=2870838 RepID=UPI001EEBFDC2|nr:DUF4157 domain-containing protein [Maribellus maritimus]MCG6187823.1 DUF4157 domain-containing protein [Maribellus maritimus]